MPEVDIAAVLAATAAALVLSATFYAPLGEQLAQASAAAAAADEPPLRALAVEVLRAAIVSVVVAGLASRAEIGDWAGGIALGLALWIGFPFVLWTGAVFHERTPWKLAAIHGGDWLVKLVAIAVIVTVLQ